MASEDTAVLDPEFYNNISSTYSDLFAKDEGLLEFLRSALQLLPSSSKILDAGCGTGIPVAASLAEAGHRIIGIDSSPAMITQIAKNVPTGSFVEADMRTYEPDSEAPFDAIFNILSLFVLSREEIEGMAPKWNSWLKSSGLLFICTMAAEDYEYLPIERRGKPDADGLCNRDIGNRFMGKIVPVTLFTREGWRALLNKAGFEVVEEMTVNFDPGEDSGTDQEPHYYIVAKKMT